MCGKSSTYGSLPPQSQQMTYASPQAMGMYSKAFSAAQQAANRPYTPYSYDPNAFVAPINQQQQMAISNINQLAQTGSPYFQAGAGMTQAAGMTSAPSIVGSYMNPYTQAVAAPTLGLLQQQQQQQLANQQGEAIKAGAFGGSRADLARAYLQGQQGLAYGKTAGDIFSAGYAPAMQAAQADLQRMMLAGGQMGQLGTGAQQSALSGAQAQLGAGTLQQQTQQAGLQALYNQFLQQQAYPFQTAQFLANVAGGLGPLYGGMTQTAQAQPFFSDPRLKDGVRKQAGGGLGALGHDGPEPIGQTYDGQDIWRYSKFGRPEIGLMAPQVEERYPEAVGDYGGYQTVDLPAATDRAAAMGRARMGGAVTEPGDYARGGYAGGGSAGLTMGDLASILAAHESMYGGLGGAAAGYGPSGPAIGGGAGLAIPKEGISAARSLHQPTEVREATPTASRLMSEIGTGVEAVKGLGELYKLYKGSANGGRIGYASGGEPEDNIGVPQQLAIPTEKISAAEPLMAKSSGSGGGQQQQGGGLMGALQTAGQIGSAASGIASGLSALASILPFSDPRLKSGIREGMQDGGEPMDIGRYLEALAGGESGGAKDPYDVLGPETKYGRAIGKYQVLPTNVPSWSEEAGLGRLTPEQFRGNREAQEAVARHKFGEYLEKTGSPSEAAAMWFAGPGYKKHMAARDTLGTSIPKYQEGFMRRAGLAADRPLALAASEGRPTTAGLEALARTAPASDEVMSAAPVMEARGISGLLRGSAPEGAGDRALDFLTSEKFLVPALMGLGAMASSPSRYLGSAVLQGLGAGAQSYMGVRKQEMEDVKNTLGVMATRFKPTTRGTFYDLVAGREVTPAERASIVNSMMGGIPHLTAPAAKEEPAVKDALSVAKTPTPTVLPAKEPGAAPIKAEPRKPTPIEQAESEAKKTPEVAAIYSQADSLDAAALQREREAEELSAQTWVEGASTEAASRRAEAQTLRAQAVEQRKRGDELRGRLITPTVESEKEATKGFSENYKRTQEAGAAAPDTIDRLRQTRDLLDDPRVYTGLFGGGWLQFKKAAQAMGWTNKQIDEGIAKTERLVSDAKRMVTDATGGSLGAGISNTDVKFLEARTVSLETSREGNKEIIDTAIKLERRKQEIADFQRKYAEAHGGKLDKGYDAALAQWARENPLFPEKERRAEATGVPPRDQLVVGRKYTNDKGETAEWTGSGFRRVGQ